MRRLGPEVATLYAELVERLVAREASRAIGHAAGSFVKKRVKGQEYCYFQQSLPGGVLRQIYLGRRSPVLDAIAQRSAEARADVDAERADIERLCAQLRAGGAAVTDAPSARVLKALADAALFRLGGVLVGTHAFIALGNRSRGTSWRRVFAAGVRLLSRRWPSAEARLSAT